jgi:hypothetical protein
MPLAVNTALASNCGAAQQKHVNDTIPVLSCRSLAIQYCTVLASNCGVPVLHTPHACVPYSSLYSAGCHSESPAKRLAISGLINQSCTPAKRNIGLRGHPMLDSLVVSVKLTQGGIRMPLHVAVRKMSAQILPGTQPNALYCGIVSGLGDHPETTHCEVFAAREPNGHRGQKIFFFVWRRNLSPQQLGLSETNQDSGVALPILLLPPFKPP